MSVPFSRETLSGDSAPLFLICGTEGGGRLFRYAEGTALCFFP